MSHAAPSPASPPSPSEPSAEAGTHAAPRLLEVSDLAVAFSTEDGRVCAVDRVTFDVAPGEIVAIVGESGCGKSVTSMALSGLLPLAGQVDGSVRLRDRELIGAPASALRELRGKDIAYVFQEPMTSLNPVLTIGRQVTEVLRRHERISRRAAHTRAERLLDIVGIASPKQRLKEYPHQLSGGTRQRVMIAMAIACEPSLLVADEPTTALDVTVQAGILDVLRDLRDRLGVGIVLITHDLGVVADLADRVLVMYAGRIVESAPVDELFAHPRHHYTVGLIGSTPTALRRGAGSRLQEIPGVVPVLSTSPDACTFAARCTAAQDQCREHQPPLDAVGSDAAAAEGTDGGIEAAGRTHAVACWFPAVSREAAGVGS